MDEIYINRACPPDTQCVQWVSVKDKLPEEDGNYLCWEKHYSESVGPPVIGLFLDGKFHTHIADDYSNVTHWMTLPTAPSR